MVHHISAQPNHIGRRAAGRAQHCGEVRESLSSLQAYIVAADHPRPPEQRIGVDERYAEVYNIDYGRCIFCGFCVEACPKDAITHGYNFELSVYSRADLLKTKDDLLITKQLQSKNYRVAQSHEDVDSEYKEV